MRTATHPPLRAARVRPGLMLLSLALAGCAAPLPPAGPSPAAAPAPAGLLPLEQLHALGQPDVLLLGEQHDAESHQAIEREAVLALARQGRLAAVVLEMAEAGRHTRGLPRTASEAEVQQALNWRDRSWPWRQYGPAVMAAVQAGVPVLGGNLPAAQNAATMRELEWDQRLDAEALAAQREAVRQGHCNLLPESQIAPMTRVQIARDASLAAVAAAATAPGQTVLVLTGSGHAHKRLGIARHLSPPLKVAAVRLAADGQRSDDALAFDAVWPTPPAPATDHCAPLRARPPAPGALRQSGP